jgi:hypothetical protein
MAAGQRLKFAEFSLEQLPEDRCRARVLLERPGESYSGTADGESSAAGCLRCAAQASLTALEQAAEPGHSFELLGAKAVKAFDARVVIVAISAFFRSEGIRLVGSYLTEGDVERGAAIAVLNATNRYLTDPTFTR